MKFRICIFFSIYIIYAVNSQLPGTKSNFLECTNDEECLPSEAKCVEKACKCPDGQIFNVDGTKCVDVLPGYGYSCVDDNQCVTLLGRHKCIDGTCQCDSGYRYFKGTCMKMEGLGNKCTKNEDCFVSPDIFAMICSETEKVCVCNEGYYNRGDHDCRPLSEDLGDTCSLDSDCQDVPNSHCTSVCAVINRSDSTLGQRSLKDNTSEMFSNFTKSVHEPCTSDNDCNEPNSYCSPFSMKCTCKRGYYYNNGVCVGELGVNVNCQQDSDCPTSATICVNGVCGCPTTYFYAPAMNKCTKSAAKRSHGRVECNTDFGCNVFGPRASCVEQESSYESFCECNEGAHLDEHDFCVDNYCKEDSECTMTNAICKDGDCMCPENYREESDFCLPNLGASCDEEDRRCIIENGQCSAEGTCVCSEGYVAADNITCLKKGILDDDCVQDIQCFLEHSVCKNNKCACMPDFTEAKGECIKPMTMGDYCTNVKECHVTLGETVLCRNSKCQCEEGYIPTYDQLECIRKGKATVNSYSVLILLFSILFSILY